ncbi:MAG: hypothetical protein HN348_17980, partial [Proteobacteria bacterium]|nr:hypothetical protein [Pseudomonadota bacterium]
MTLIVTSIFWLFVASAGAQDEVNAEELLAQGNEALEAYDLYTAQYAFEAALEADAELIDALRGRQEVLNQRQDLTRKLEQGATRLTRLKESDPRSARECRTLLSFYKRILMWAPSEPQIETDHELVFNECVDIHMDRGTHFFEELEDYYQATVEFKAVIELAPKTRILRKAEGLHHEAEQKLKTQGGIIEAARLVEEEPERFREAILRYELELRDDPKSAAAKEGIEAALNGGTRVLMNRATEEARSGDPIRALLSYEEAKELGSKDKPLLRQLDDDAKSTRTLAAKAYQVRGDAATEQGFYGLALLYHRMAKSLDTALAGAKAGVRDAEKKAEEAIDLQLLVALPDKRDFNFRGLATDLRVAIEELIEEEKRFKRWGIHNVTAADLEAGVEPNAVLRSAYLKVETHRDSAVVDRSKQYIHLQTTHPNPHYGRTQRDLELTKARLAEAHDELSRAVVEIAISAHKALLASIPPQIKKQNYKTHHYKVTEEVAQIRGDVGFKIRSALTGQDFGQFCPVSKLTYEDYIVTEPIVVDGDPDLDRPRQVLQDTHSSSVPKNDQVLIDAMVATTAKQAVGNLLFSLENHADRFWL